jgi:hypothetical protein
VFSAAINSYSPIHVVTSIKQLAGVSFYGKIQKNDVIIILRVKYEFLYTVKIIFYVQNSIIEVFKRAQ